MNGNTIFAIIVTLVKYLRLGDPFFLLQKWNAGKVIFYPENLLSSMSDCIQHSNNTKPPPLRLAREQIVQQALFSPNHKSQNSICCQKLWMLAVGCAAKLVAVAIRGAVGAANNIRHGILQFHGYQHNIVCS